MPKNCCFSNQTKLFIINIPYIFFNIRYAKTRVAGGDITSRTYDTSKVTVPFPAVVDFIAVAADIARTS